MFLRKVAGFLFGFVGSFMLLVLASSFTGLRPIGPGWFLLMMSVGGLTLKFFVAPRKSIEVSVEKVSKATEVPRERIRTSWWLIDPRLRLLIVTSVVWMMVAYFIQDEYETNLKVVYLPVIGLFTFYFGNRIFVQGKTPLTNTEVD